MVEVSLDHSQRIRISPEFTLRIEAIVELPVDCNVLPSVVGTDRDLVDENLELYKLTEILRRESDFSDGLLFSCFVIENESVLVQENTLLIYDICVQVREFVSVLNEAVFPLRS